MINTLANFEKKYGNISISFCSKNPCGSVGVAAVLESLSYSSSIEELLLSNLTGSVGIYWTDVGSLSKALGKLFELTVSLKKVKRTELLYFRLKKSFRLKFTDIFAILYH